jgi:flavorubredoxin
MEDIQKIKKALFLENEFFNDMKGHYIYDVYEHLIHKGVNCVVIDQASGKKEQVVKEAIDSDAIFFASTFLYESEVKSVGNLLKALPSKLIFGQSIGSGSLEGNIKKF